MVLESSRMTAIEALVEPSRSDLYVWARVQRAVGRLVMSDALRDVWPGLIAVVVGAQWIIPETLARWDESQGDPSIFFGLGMFPIMPFVGLGLVGLGAWWTGRALVYGAAGMAMWLRGRREEDESAVGLSDADARVREYVNQVREEILRARRSRTAKTRHIVLTASAARTPARHREWTPTGQAPGQVAPGSARPADAGNGAASRGAGGHGVAPAGWYIPDGESEYRYWDGAAWTSHPGLGGRTQQGATEANGSRG